MVRTLALSSGDHGLKARSDYSLLNFFLGCPGSTPRSDL